MKTGWYVRSRPPIIQGLSCKKSKFRLCRFIEISVRKSSLSDCTLPHTTTVFLFKVNSEPFVHKTEISSFRVLQGERGMRRNVLTEVSVALFFYVGLRLPVIFRLPFLVFDLACLVCIVQIKVVSTSFPACTRVSPSGPSYLLVLDELASRWAWPPPPPLILTNSKASSIVSIPEVLHVSICSKSLGRRDHFTIDTGNPSSHGVLRALYPLASHLCGQSQSLLRAGVSVIGTTGRLGPGIRWSENLSCGQS